jgi:hypothetical protein
MAVTRCDAQESGGCAEGVFDGFGTRISANIADLIIQHVTGDSAVNDAVFSEEPHAPTPSDSSKTLAGFFPIPTITDYRTPPCKFKVGRVYHAYSLSKDSFEFGDTGGLSLQYSFIPSATPTSCQNDHHYDPATCECQRS